MLTIADWHSLIVPKHIATVSHDLLSLLVCLRNVFTYAESLCRTSEGAVFLPRMFGDGLAGGFESISAANA